MVLFSWFVNTRGAPFTYKKNAQTKLKVDGFTLNTMWPTAKVRKNVNVEQQEFTPSLNSYDSTVKYLIHKPKKT